MMTQESTDGSKSWIRNRVSPLRKVIDGKTRSARYYGKNRVLEDRLIDAATRQEINKILGKNFTEIRIIRHTFFSVTGTTCMLKSGDLSYSEAFAGSGEFAAVMLVDRIRSAKEKSLILLDEPEVSLHPGAQEQLVHFLEKEIRLKKHQVIFATHSPSMIRNLPPEAIKVFIPDSQTGKIAMPSQRSVPETAFFHIGEPIVGRKTIIVEDALAAELVKRAMRLMDGSLGSMIDVKYFPGGSETLWAYFVPTYAAEGRADILVLFDGDKRPKSVFPDTKTIPESDNNLLSAIIRKIAGVDVNLKPDGAGGSSKANQKFELQRRFIDWSRIHTDYLPGNGNPEDLLWMLMEKDELASAIRAPSTKECFALLARQELDLLLEEKVDSKMILDTQIRRIARLGKNIEEMSLILERLVRFVST